jgi:acetyl-CoA carboxylase carboxyl transferase subunit alpha
MMGNNISLDEKLQILSDKITSIREEIKKGKKDKLSELVKLRADYRKLAREYNKRLSAWERVQLARHPKRPHTSDYINALFTDFIELHGDRKFGDDKSIIAGFGFFENQPVAVIGHEKGKNINERKERNFGMPHPEGYRKAVRIMKLAERFNRPVITFIDTPGAFPGVGAEERGQSAAIAESIYTMASLKVPSIAIIIGEGGSGGALALGVADKVLMLENSIYSVISPEGAAAILFKTHEKAPEMAENLKITAKDLKKLGIIDCVIPEPRGGAHLQQNKVFRMVKRAIRYTLRELLDTPIDQLLEKRKRKYYSMSKHKEK